MLRSVTSKAAAGRTRAIHVLARSKNNLPKASKQHVGRPTESIRAFAAATTSEKKRALNAQQLKGSSKTEAATTTQSPPTTAAVEGSAVAADSGGGGGGVGPVLALLLATGGAGAAYYNGYLDEYLGGGQKKSAPVVQKEKEAKEKPKTNNTNVSEKVPAPQKVAKTTQVAAAASKTTTKGDESLAKVAKEEIALSKKEMEEFNEIIADVIGEATEEAEGLMEAVAAIAEEEKNNAAAAKAAKVAAKAAAASKKKQERASKKAAAAEAAIAAAAAQEPPIAMVSATIETSALDESKILAEIEDLKKQLNARSDTALEQAHTELAKLGMLDVMGIDIDKMTQSQLKVRLVQMARDLEERTKWEAVRLQEFLNMKEKEVEDRFVLLIKKLRFEAEIMQEEKLAKQKKILTTQAEEAIKEQQTRSDAFLENTMQIQEKAHADDKLSFEQTTKEGMDAKYEEFLGKELTKIKEEFATKMNQRVRQMEELTKKLTDLEISLSTSQDFQVGSLEAHRITAAAIALMEKLESGDPAGAAVRALEAVASDNAVVSSAVQALPASASLSGVSTLQELQAAFDETIYPQCRKAANVPTGVDGLEGQLLGSFFSFVRFPPGPQEAAPESEKDAPEYVLSRIKRYVQLGELEKAISESKKLEGQVAYTAKDWESQARARVAVEKALKVIRMECALANENLTQATAV